MKCPNDDSMLVMSDRQGVEIDYCPQCRGVWLDRGELDKILERTPTMSNDTPGNAQYDQPRPQMPHSSQADYNGYRQKSDDYRYKKHKKENFLGDIFDF